MKMKTGLTNIQHRELVITRIFDAPRERVWKAWTEPERVKHWWGPKVFTAPIIKIDLRVGGKYLYCMRSPDGKDYWSTGVFREIVAPERLVVTDSFSDEKGNIVPATYYGMSEFPLELPVTMLFEDYEGKTKFSIRYSDIAGISESDLKNMEQGWNESIDKLAALLKTGNRTRLTAETGKQELFITRELDAPRELVFKAFTDPALYVEWLGPRRLKMKLETFEPKSGGSWRYIHEDENGNKFGFHGVIHEVLEPSRLIDTFEFEGLPETGHVSLEVLTLEELPGDRTRLNTHVVFLSVADRDGMLQSGMEQGLNESHERLDELLEKMWLLEHAHHILS